MRSCEGREGEVRKAGERRKGREIGGKREKQEDGHRDTYWIL